MNLLFPSAGRRVELLRAFRQAHAELGLDGKIVATDIDPLATALTQADRVYMVPRLNDPALPAALAEICKREEIDLLIPLVDRDIPMLVRHRREFEEAGARPLIPTDGAAAITADKYLTFEFFTQLGVPVPRSWLAHELATDEVAFPLFIKPRFGSAGEHTFKVRNQRELDFFLEYVPEPIVQEYLEGPEITNDVLCDLEGNVAAVVSRKRIEVRSGEVAKGVTVHDPQIIECCATIAKGLETAGPITVQCMLNHGTPFFTEVNPRFGGGVPLGIAAGVHYPKLLLSFAAGLRPDTPPLGTYATGIYFSRFDESLVLTEEERARIQSLGL